MSRILRKVVRPIPTLKNVEDTVNILQKGQAASGSTTALTSQQKYDNYKQLLLEACQTYDAESRSSKSRHRANCILLHKLQHEEDIDFDATTDVDTIMAFKSLQQGNYPPPSNQPIVSYKATYNHAIEPQGMHIGYPTTLLVSQPTYATYNHDLAWQ